MQTAPQVILVTGASSGLGHAIALALARDGHLAYASMRETAGKNAQPVAQLRQLVQREQIALHPLELNVLSGAGCQAAVDAILGREGRLDVVVNNAGMLMQGITESFANEQVARIIGHHGRRFAWQR